MLMVMGCSNTFVGSEDVTSPDRIDGRGDPADTDAPVDAVDDRADTMSADGLDAVDEPLDGARDRMEAADDRPDATVPDRMDVMVDRADAAATDADALEVEAAVDATGEEIASPGDADCPRDPPAGPPPEVGRSCGAGRAPAEHCREVAFCGGPYRMGSTEAWDVTSVAAEGRNLQMRVCDLHDAVARGGYVDAYEVSVARYRAWVNAGFPHPRAGESFFNGLQWMSQFDRDLVIPNRATMDDRVPGVVSTDAMCTWSGTPGVNDDLPISCVPVMAAIAFCWWESKHLITEIGWEYLATNRGTTPTPFGAIPAADAVCSRGDVGGYTGQCPRTAMPTRIGTHPGGATRNPAGVHDLWGGMQEWVIGLASPYSQYFPAMPFCSRDAPRSVDGAFEVSGGSLARGEVMQRGPAWFQNATEFAYFYHSATRAGVAGVPIPKGRNPTSVRVGFRCARWLPEPR